MKNNQDTKFKLWAEDFFGNKFILRFLTWGLGTFMFAFGLVLILAANFGFGTYDSLFQPIRLLLGVKDPKRYGTYILIPSGSILVLITIVLNAIRTKKVRTDYILAFIPVAVVGFILDGLFKIPFISELVSNTGSSNWPVIDHPILLLWLMIALPFYGFGIGIMSGARLMPNCFAMIVDETSKWAKWSFKKSQWIYDGAFVALGIIITIINIYTHRVDSTEEITWPYALHYIGPMTIVIILTQGILIGSALHFVEKIYGYHNLKAAA